MLEDVKTIYLIGIKGTGMSSLAVLLKKMGYQITGSDVHEQFPSEVQLKTNNISYHDGFNTAHLVAFAPDLVIMSTSYNDRNIEVAQAKLSRMKLITYPEAVGAISQKLISVAVCGSHGKTTTSSMLGTLMQTNHETVTLTGTVAEHLNKEVDSPKYFVFEADEYQNKFQYYRPQNVVLTNVDFDHPDYFQNTDHYYHTFADFIHRILGSNGFVVFNYDDALNRKIFENVSGTFVSYGFDEKSNYRITEVGTDLNEFVITLNGREFLHVKLGVYGRHNILDATASAIMASHLGISPDVIVQELAAFSGIQRRMQVYPSEKFIVMDDYGHHPTEIAITLQAIRNKYKDKNIVTVFHPHTFTRTKALLTDFGKSFKDANLVLVLDIFPSARETAGGVHAQDVIRELEKNGSKAIYTPTIPDAADYILAQVPHGSVVVTMGAGDAWQLCGLLK